MRPAPDPSSSESPGPGGDTDSLPRQMLEDLAGLYPAPRVPAAVDRRILNGAAATYARQARNRRLLRWVGAGAAAAAAILIAVLASPRAGGPPVATAATMAGDVDHNGRVDILDAFGLARKLRDARGQSIRVTPPDDANRDGVVDDRDVDFIAKMAVRVNDAAVGELGVAAVH